MAASKCAVGVFFALGLISISAAEVFARSYGRWGDSSDFAQWCGPARDNMMMLGALAGGGHGGGYGSYYRYTDQIARGWYLNKQMKGFQSNIDQNNAWAYRQDWANYVRRNCP